MPAILLFCFSCSSPKYKAVFIIIDGVPADVLENISTPAVDAIASAGGYTRAYVGGEKGTESESPTISSPGYMHLLTGTWSNKHNVWDNDIDDPNYDYKNIFRIVEESDSSLKTAIFSTWLDNRTKLIGEGLPDAGNFKLDYSFDGFEYDTVNFPHVGRKYISDIDEHISREAARYILAEGPDLSWVYLEYTDDIGHMYGDSPEMTEAVKSADAQVGRIWEAVKERMNHAGEEWMVVVTTDHGRSPVDGKDHGGQSERERTTWIATNVSHLNARFYNNPGIVDIMPSILDFMEILIPEETMKNIDGVSFLKE
ncbi:MAG TPA: alkaline phosphatase family protein [Cyclobacteriaceae bacterium]|nr:alkaline phosphatase family protein [Cyclobacteriaceae bacterium]